MLKKFKDFCDKPITWGGYLKLCGYSLVASVITGASIYAIEMHNINKEIEKWNKENQTNET